MGRFRTMLDTQVIMDYPAAEPAESGVIVHGVSAGRARAPVHDPFLGAL